MAEFQLAELTHSGKLIEYGFHIKIFTNTHATIKKKQSARIEIIMHVHSNGNNNNMKNKQLVFTWLKSCFQGLGLVWDYDFSCFRYCCCLFLFDFFYISIFIFNFYFVFSCLLHFPAHFFANVWVVVCACEAQVSLFGSGIMGTCMQHNTPASMPRNRQ